MRVDKGPVETLKDGNEDRYRAGGHEIGKIAWNGHDTLLSMGCASTRPPAGGRGPRRRKRILILPHRAPRSWWGGRRVCAELRIVIGHRRCSRSSFCAIYRRLAEVDVMPYSPDHKRGTRQRILKAAARLFNKRGFSEATIEGIMTAAGLTHGGFYRHFNDELYAEAVRHFLHKARRREARSRGLCRRSRR
jgi:hypothetical protein